MTLAFERRYELTLARPVKGKFFDRSPNALVARGMEIRFKVERSLESSPNTATVDVYNLAPATRAEFQRLPLHVRLDVGFARDKQLARLIEGDLMYVAPDRSGGDIITSFTVGDGERAYVDARVPTKTFRSGVDARTAITEIAKTMGLSMPTSAAGAGELLKQFSTGLTVRGPSRDQMTKILRGSGFGWSIQDGQLQLLRNQDVRAGLAEIISPQFGLIDSPQYCAPKEPGKPPTLKFKVILRPQLIPGGKVKMESAEINGFFRVAKVIHTGDFRDNDWYSDVEANPL